MLVALRNFRRLLTILFVLIRQAVAVRADGRGLLSCLANAKARKLRRGQRLVIAFEQLGPSFVKLGQALSTRPDLVGDEISADLSELQDRLSPFDGAEAQLIIEAELGQKLDKLYTDFNKQAIAAASIAQVHLAVTTEGMPVAVKVLRPNIEQRFAEDITLFFSIAHLIELVFPSSRRLRPVDAIKTFEEMVKFEMDLRFEAAAAAEMSENFAGDETFRIPAVDWHRTSRRVMTLERVRGISVDEIDEIRKAGHNIDNLVGYAAAAFFNMVFRDGFFHADMHPGNLFIGERGELIAVDFGITGRIDRQTRLFLGEMLLGFLNGNYRRVAEIHFEAGFVPNHKSVDIFTQACRSIAEPILGKPLNEISVARLLGQLFEITDTFDMEAQPQLLLLQKSMLVIEGVGRCLAPEANMWNLARPLIENWMQKNLNPLEKVKVTMETLANTLEALPRLVENAERTMENLRHGGFSHASSSSNFSKNIFHTLIPWILAALFGYLYLKK